MKKSLNKQNIFFVLVGLLLLSLMFSFFAPLSSHTPDAASTSVDQVVKVTATSRLNQSLNPDNASLTFDEQSCTSYYWRDIQYLTIKYEKNNLVTITPNDVGDHKYEYKIEMQMLRKRVEDGGEFNQGSSTGSQGVDTFEKRIILAGTEDTEEGLDNISVDYYIDKTDDPDKKSEDFGWGIYKFTLTINNVPYESRFIYIKPSPVIEAPKIKGSHSENSQTGLSNSWDFTIENYDKYTDDSCIAWFVNGVDADENRYSLTEQEIGVLDEFPVEANHNYKAIGAAVPRVGSTFHFEASFDSKEIKGTWQVFCVVFDKPFDLENISTLNRQYKSNVVEENNISNISQGNIYWIIGVAAAVVLIAIVVIIVVSIRKEKVW